MDTVSIVSTGRYVPKDYAIVEEAAAIENLDRDRLRELDVYKVYIDKKNECYEMAVNAAKTAIEKAEITPLDIDVVILSNGYGRKHLIFDEPSYIKHRIGTKRASAFRVEQGCNSSIVSLNYANSRLKADRNVCNVLVVSLEFFKKPFINRWNSFSSSILADGASAAVLQRSTKGFNILDIYGITNGRFSDIWRTDVGGLKKPLLNNKSLISEFNYDVYKTGQEYLSNETNRKILYDMLVENNKAVFDVLLDRLDMSYKDIDKLVMYNVGRSVLNSIIDIVGMEEDKTSMYLAKQYGHIGNADILFNLDHMMEDNKFKNGDVVGLFSAGVGFSWGSVLLKYTT